MSASPLQPALDQLNTVAQTGRRWLCWQRLAQALAALVGLFFLAAGLDWLLRLPGLVRAILALVALAGLGIWLFGRLKRARGFKPSLEQLALRAERLHPDLSGLFASAVCFAETEAKSKTATHTSANHKLTRASMAVAADRLQGRDLTGLLNGKPTRNSVTAGLLAVLFWAIVLGLAPGWTQTAMQRWLLPFGDTAWPKRVALAWQDQVPNDADHPLVWPADTVLPLTVLVERGNRDGLNVSVTLSPMAFPAEKTAASLVGGDPRLDTTRGQAQTLRMQPMDDGQRRLLWQPPTGQQTGLWQATVSAGDAELPPMWVKWVPVPTVTQTVWTIEPPAYAKDLVPVAKHQAGHNQGLSVRAWVGSQVQATLHFNKPMTTPASGTPGIPGSGDKEEQGVGGENLDAANGNPGDAVAVSDALSGGSDGGGFWPAISGVEIASDRPVAQGALPGAGAGVRFEARWGLTQDVQWSPAGQDTDGLVLRDPPAYRIEAAVDGLPEIAIDPLPSTAFLPTAVVPVRVQAQDDLGLSHVALTATTPGMGMGGNEAETANGGRGSTGLTEADFPGAWEQGTLLAEDVRRLAEQTLAPEVSLADLGAQPGQSILLLARAQDVYNVDGQTHAPRWAYRRLTVIDEPAFLDQLQRELAAIGDQVEPAAELQERARSQAPSEAAQSQTQIRQQLSAAEAGLQRVQDQIAMNRHERPETQARLDRTQQALATAQQASQAAETALNQGDEQTGRQAQAESAEALGELVQMLQAGQSTALVESQLRRMQAEQNRLAEQAQQLQAQTAGLSREQLSAEQTEALDRLAAEQRQLAEDAQALTEQMEDAARQLSEQDPENQSLADKAAAEALQEAAQTARAQALSQTMQQAAQNASQNQMSQAQSQQSQSQQTLSQMLEQVEQAAQKQQAMLREQMRQLQEVLARLVAQQKQALANLTPLRGQDNLTGLVPEQRGIRQQTMLARRDAEQAEETKPLVEWIVSAVNEQGNALDGLGAGQGMQADAAERAALAALEKTLERVNDMQAQADAQEAQEKRKALAEAYQKLADQQQTILDTVTQLSPNGQVGRRQRPQLIQQAGLENGLVTETQALVEDVAETAVFVRLHEQIAQAGGRAETALRLGQAGAVVKMDLARIQRHLQFLADALGEDEDDSPFAEKPQEGSQQPGGEGSPGGQGNPSPVPPLAELKLLRALQADLLTQTQALSDVAGQGGVEPAVQQTWQTELLNQQNTLKAMGQALLEAMEQQGGM